MTSVITLRKISHYLTFSHLIAIFINFNAMESNIHAPVLLNLFNSLRKRYKMLGKLHILHLSLFLNSFNKLD